ncbi:hypothetical protein HAX54_021326 [Datura stramonium]|uniref:Uncharacterized protein n=1 Tax=Datura stramonium TaxID=4076 RepID=A0ABS8UUJ2_DATST|nr:hypothetical protein [Datura stramonium]
MDGHDDQSSVTMSCPVPCVHWNNFVHFLIPFITTRQDGSSFSLTSHDFYSLPQNPNWTFSDPHTPTRQNELSLGVMSDGLTHGSWEEKCQVSGRWLPCSK